MDVLADFFSERCLPAPDAQVLGDDLYVAYGRWAEASGEKPVSKNQFGRVLTDRGYERGHIEKGTIYKGLRLQREVPGI
jgi:putative DNA primase/helicase